MCPVVHLVVMVFPEDDCRDVAEADDRSRGSSSVCSIEFSRFVLVSVLLCAAMCCRACCCCRAQRVAWGELGMGTLTHRYPSPVYCTPLKAGGLGQIFAATQGGSGSQNKCKGREGNALRQGNQLYTFT